MIINVNNFKVDFFVQFLSQITKKNVVNNIV